MKIEIKNRVTGKIIISGKCDSIKDALEKNEGADLRGADLRGADLNGAYLNGDLWICGSLHTVNYYKGHISIGCEYHSLEYWLIMYERIGVDNNYTPEEIQEYYQYIKLCKQFKEVK